MSVHLLSVVAEFIDSTNQVVQPMKRKSDRQVHDAPEMEPERMPIQSLTLAPGKTLARALTTPTPPEQIPERNDTRHYARHWGINE